MLQLNVGELEGAKKQLFHREEKRKEDFFLFSSEKVLFLQENSKLPHQLHYQFEFRQENMNNFWKWLGAIVLPFVAYFIVSFVDPILHFIIRLRSDYDAPGFLGWGARLMEWIHVNIVVYLVCAAAAAAFSALPAFIAPKFKKALSVIYGLCFIVFIGFGAYASMRLGREMGFEKWATIISSIIGALIGCVVGCSADEE